MLSTLFFIRIPILCRQIHDNYFSNNVSAGKIIFFWGGHLFVRTSLPFCNNVTLTSVVLYGALVMIFCLQTNVKICHLDICHKQIKRGKKHNDVTYKKGLSRQLMKMIYNSVTDKLIILLTNESITYKNNTFVQFLLWFFIN